MTGMNEIATPRTDAAWTGRMREPTHIPFVSNEFDVVKADFARQLERENAAYQHAKELVHKRFGFKPHPDDPKKCNCAYCAREFEPMAEHAALMEIELLALEQDKKRLDWWELHMLDYGFGLQMDKKWSFVKRKTSKVFINFDTFRQALTAAMED